MTTTKIEITNGSMILIAIGLYCLGIGTMMQSCNTGFSSHNERAAAVCEDAVHGREDLRCVGYFARK